MTAFKKIINKAFLVQTFLKTCLVIVLSFEISFTPISQKLLKLKRKNQIEEENLNFNVD